MFKTKSQTDTAMVAALARADETLAERNKIQATIAKTSDEMKSTETDLGHELERLAVEEADLALAEGAGERETAAQRRVQKLRLRLEAQQARLRGLSQKLIEHEDRVREAQDAMAVARDGWMRARAAEFSAEYEKAVASFAAVLRKGVAIGDALGDDALSAAMRQTRIYGPENISVPVIDMEPVRPHPVCGVMERYPVWQDDPAAVSIHDSLVDVRLKSESLARLADEIRLRREEARRLEQKHRFDSAPGPKTVSYEFSYPQEYSPVTPVEVANERRG